MATRSANRTANPRSTKSNPTSSLPIEFTNFICSAGYDLVFHTPSPHSRALYLVPQMMHIVPLYTFFDDMRLKTPPATQSVAALTSLPTH